MLHSVKNKKSGLQVAHNYKKSPQHQACFLFGVVVRFLIMDIKISLNINVDADSENDAKNAITIWILENIPSVLPEEDILINSIDFG